MSCCLTERGIGNIVLERGRIGQRWRDERWDSLRLLSPNWMARLPGWQYRGDDQDGFMTMPEFIRYLEAYAESFEAPIQCGTTVQCVERIDGSHLRVITDRGTWAARHVVIATGFCDRARVPSFAAGVPSEVEQVVPADYRRPSQLPPGNVVIVGASAQDAPGWSAWVPSGHRRIPRRNGFRRRHNWSAIRTTAISILVICSGRACDWLAEPCPPTTAV